MKLMHESNLLYCYTIDLSDPQGIVGWGDGFMIPESFGARIRLNSREGRSFHSGYRTLVLWRLYKRYH